MATEPTTTDKPQPRLQSMQVAVRLIYEDGTVAAAATQPTELPRDELEPSISISEADVIRHLKAHMDAATELIEKEGSGEMYKRAIAEAQARRDNAGQRADKATERRRARIQAGEPTHEVGRDVEASSKSGADEGPCLKPPTADPTDGGDCEDGTGSEA